MVNLKQEYLETILRKRVSTFLRSRTSQRASLRPFWDKISSLNDVAFLFGGTLRDLMLFGLRKNPRDVDIVVHSFSNELKSFLKPHIRKNTRFGGIELHFGHWDIDLWELSCTWAFQAGLVKPEGYESLPKTTFLDVQAIAIEVAVKPGQSRRVHEHGFFKAMYNKTIDINFEENPYPNRCVLSSLTTANKLDFKLSPRLIRYILHHTAKMDLQELCSYQKQQLGFVPFTTDILHCWIHHLTSSYRKSRSTPATLPTDKPAQRLLPWRSPFDMPV
jgi:hypothetical protein